ncbi:hypothetical protein BKA70DRAFT_1476157 [Coprinopsis sp. MPI-PUGE-AT-0042]|nr:hypothetical protein BKA70DRAFT_1476157 [Coprinopsis sp. MPI-PUGE-AT-0042]
MPLSHRPLPPVYPTPSSTLSSFSSSVELVSSFRLSEETTWTVYKDNALMHQEQTVICMSSPAAGRHGYICDLVPSLWPMLCNSEDPNSITIVQKVRSARETSFLATTEHYASPVRLASIVYHFNIPDYTMFKLRPANPANTGIPTNATPSSSTLS